MKQKEYSWMLMNPDIENQYGGENIAMIREDIVAHCIDFQEVLNESKKYGKKSFIHKAFSSEKELVV